MKEPEHLSVEHLRILKVDSGICDEVIKNRGYRTVTIKAELRRLGFSDAQTRVPALLIPVWGVTGEVALHQIRPDDPRVLNGKALRYETPRGSRMALDVHPSVRNMIADPQVPLWIVEGVKKADALVSQGCCAIALLGVWSWRGTSPQGGKTALSDWECVALNGRTVYIAFDSDVMRKLQVHDALTRLKSFLEMRV